MHQEIIPFRHSSLYSTSSRAALSRDNEISEVMKYIAFMYLYFCFDTLSSLSFMTIHHACLLLTCPFRIRPACCHSIVRALFHRTSETYFEIEGRDDASQQLVRIRIILKPTKPSGACWCSSVLLKSTLSTATNSSLPPFEISHLVIGVWCFSIYHTMRLVQ